MSIFTSLGGFFDRLFHSDKAKAALHTAAEIAIIAEPIVKQIATLAGNKTVDSAIAAYDALGVPLVFAINANDPNGVNNALKDLAVAGVKKALPADKAATAISIINMAVEMAVNALKANKAA